MSKNKPQYSIIVPVYNTEQYLNRCISSILAQTINDFELILIDDGSKDNSGMICEDFAKKDRRIILKHKSNGGVSSARNMGLDLAQGRQICFIDSDDYVDECFLEIFNKRSADIIVQGYYAKNMPLKEKNKEYYVGLPSIIFHDDLKKLFDIMYDTKNIGYLPFRCFKNDIIQEYNIRFNENYTFREDEEFICRYLIRCQNFSTINEGSYHYEMPNYKKKYRINKKNLDCIISSRNSLVQLIDTNHPLILSFNNAVGYYLCDLGLKDFVEKLKVFYEINKEVDNIKSYCLKAKFSYYLSKVWCIIMNKQ